MKFWSTTYLIKIIDLSPQYAMISFGILCISAPLIGVFVGGYISDKLVCILLIIKIDFC